MNTPTITALRAIAASARRAGTGAQIDPDVLDRLLDVALWPDEIGSGLEAGDNPTRQDTP